MNKKIFALAMSAVLLLSGCAPANKPSGNVYSIPDNGIVKAATLQKVKSGGGLAVFKGEDNKISYKWTFVGPDIKKPKDVNLKVSFTSGYIRTNSDERTIRRKAPHQDVFMLSPSCRGALPGEPTLSIDMGKQWKSGIYYLYSFKKKSGVSKLVKELRVVDGSSSSFSQKKWSGNYFIVAKKLKDTENSSSSSCASVSASSSAAAPGKSPSAGASVSAGRSSGKGTATGGNTDAVAGAKSLRAIHTTETVTHRMEMDIPDPVDNGSKDTNEAAGQVTMTIRCDTAVKNWSNLRPNKQDHKVVPADGCIFPLTTLNIYKGETVYDLLVYVCEHYRIQMQHKDTPIYGSEYIQGINNLYEFDGGNLSGWMYEVDSWYPNYGVSRYVLKNGDNVQWNYTCDLGRDLGQNWLSGK